MSKMMKHIKLFEDFQAKYEMIKPLPEPDEASISDHSKNQFYFINTDDKNEISELAFHLKKMKYNLENQTNISPKSVYWAIKDISDNDKKPRLARVYSINDDVFSDTISPNWVEIKFDDYFKLKSEFRGHKLRKYNV